mmetsp:Transcript_15755/g.32662  ORF Transcript_15755/g.32662 Transcript_15755/m.32662 type:complete len:165 (+) Transcript_15755:140-634(+)
MAQPIKQKLAPTKKCIPGIPGRCDDSTNDCCFASSLDKEAVAKVANSDAYMEEPIAPVNSDREPTAPNKAPASPGGAKFASKACNAGIATQPNEMTAIDSTKRDGVDTSPAPDNPSAYTSNPRLMDVCNPRRGTSSRGTIASVSPTMTRTGPDCAWVHPKRTLV